MNYTYLPASSILERYKEKLASIRTGRVNSSILDQILVEAYDSKYHFNELSTITTPAPAQLLITPFDKSVLSAMEKAIVDSNIGVNPVNDGAGLRLVFPPLTEENKKQRIKEVSALLEESLISMRSHRQDILKKLKAQKENGEMGEDDLRREETALQKEIDALTGELKEAAKEKEAEIMKV